MTDHDPCCTKCRSVNLRLIGGVWVGTQGVEYDGAALTRETLLKLIESGGSFTRELMFCTSCGTSCLLSEAKEAAGIEAKDYLWQGTDVGTNVPIICPECSNSTEFIRRVTRLASVEEEVTIKQGEVETANISAVNVEDEIVTAFECGVMDCSGEIILHKYPHVLKRA